MKIDVKPSPIIPPDVFRIKDIEAGDVTIFQGYDDDGPKIIMGVSNGDGGTMLLYSNLGGGQHKFTVLPQFGNDNSQVRKLKRGESVTITITV